MLGPIKDRIRGMCLFGASAMLAAGAFACASSNVVDSTVGTTGQIADVRVEQVGDTTQVTLLGVDHPVFTAFQETDPARVIIDLVSIHPEQLMEPVAVYDGLVDEVSLAPFSTGSGEAMTRVEITLAEFIEQGTASPLLIRAGLLDNTGNVVYQSGIQLDISTTGGGVAAASGVTDADGFFDTEVTMDMPKLDDSKDKGSST